MQTLQAGSFLNLENSESVEALKFTARRLAEHTAAVVAENLPPAALANLASNLWEKAEYVARETERRRLREIFAENFTERFRELKPDTTPADDLLSKVLSTTAATENIGSADNAPALENVEESQSETAAGAERESSASPQQTEKIEVRENRDEFLGFVKTDEQYVAVPGAGTLDADARNETVQATTQAASGSASETSKSENKQKTAEREISAENANAEKSSPVAAAKVPAVNSSQAAGAGKTNALQTETKEPFEFGKCTINLNLTLLPSSADDGNRRRAIISASSHGSPPEIEFLEIVDGENLTEIAELVRGKLAGFKNGLPAKYIEQLRQSKTNSAKKTAPAKTSIAPTKPETNQSNLEKTSGSQSAQNSSGNKEESQIEITVTKETEAVQSVSTVAVIPQSVTAANNVQPSLF